MKTAAIICEYNPFHNGHLLQIKKTRELLGDDTVIIALMSGSTVQRGSLAIYGKYKRAEAAIGCGVDLVLELPCPYTVGSAEYFARGAVSLLDGLGGIDCLIFGSESGDIDSLRRIAENMRSERYREALLSQDREESHQRNAQRIYKELFGGDYPTTPNDILGVEYISALIECKSSIEPMTYKREKGFSATKTRNIISSGADASAFIPSEAYSVLAGEVPTSGELYSAIALHSLLSTDGDTLSSYFGMNGGVSGYIKKNVSGEGNIFELTKKLACKKYSESRLRRGILCSLLKITKEDMEQRPPVTTLLAANEAGRRYLAKIKKTARVAVVTKTADEKKLSPEAFSFLDMTKRADALFALSRAEPVAEMIRRVACMK